MAAYCVEADLLLGETPLPGYINKTVYLDNSAEEIDSALAARYTTPIVVPDVPQNRPTKIFLKHVNAKLCSGRMIMAAATGAELSETHAYGRYLVDEALRALGAVASGEYVLPGAEQIDPVASDTGGVRIANVDTISQVEGFYDQLQNPFVPYPNDPYPGYLGGYPYGG